MQYRLLVILVAVLGLGVGTASPAAAAPVWVRISTAPPGATVYVDGKERGPQGIATGTFRVRLSPGGHRLLFELVGYQPLEQSVQIGPRAQSLAFTLERAPARLAVRTPAASDAARDGELFIDGEPKGKVPSEFDLKEGSHLLEVRKPGFKAYSETVELRAAELKTVLVTLTAEIKRGTLLIAATGEAVVYVDGQARGPAPQVVELDQGEHGVEVRQRESGEVLWQQRVTAVAGQQVRVQAEFKVADKTGSLLVVAPDDSEIIIDGTKNVGPNQVVAGLRAGQHVIVVQAKGSLPVTKIVEIEPGKQRVEQVRLEKTAAARGVATLRVVMVNPVEAAEYFVNGRRVKEEDLLGDKGVEVPAGENIVVVQREGFGKATKTVHVAAGATERVQVTLQAVAVASMPSVPIEQPPPGNLVMGSQPVAPPVYILPPRPMRPEMSASLSAVTNDPGRFTVDLGGGYPYFVNLGIAVGAARRGMFGLDAGVELRSNFYLTEVGVRLRAQLFQAGPIAGGLSLLIGGGAGPDERNDFIMELGVPITLIAGRLVQLTARPYLQIYSDRSCPSAATATAENVTRGDACTQALQSLASGGQDSYGALDRFTSARFLIQAALEISLTRNINLFMLIEGAPGLQRQSLTRKYNLLLFQEVDYGVYGRAGVTFKF